MNLNRAFILGRVTATPELRATKLGQAVASLGVASNRTWTGKDGAKQEEVEFHNVVIFGRQAEVASQFLQKGSLVFIEGRLATRTWTDKDDHERRATEIICENMQLGPRPQASSETMPVTKRKPETEETRIVPMVDDTFEEREVGDIYKTDYSGKAKPKLIDEEEAPSRAMQPLFGEKEINPEEVPF